MKECIALVIAASMLGLAGCSTTPRVTMWEYKVAGIPPVPAGSSIPSPQEWRDRAQQLLNDVGKEGWVLVSQNEGRVFYLKRPIK